MSSGADAAAVSSEWAGQSDQPRSTGVAQASGFVRRTAIKLSGRVNELTDGTVCAVDAATGAEIGPYRKSRLRHLAVTGSRSLVIMLTAHGDDETRWRCLEACATAFLEKPVRTPALLDAVGKARAST